MGGYIHLLIFSLVAAFTQAALRHVALSSKNSDLDSRESRIASVHAELIIIL